MTRHTATGKRVLIGLAEHRQLALLTLLGIICLVLIVQTDSFLTSDNIRSILLGCAIDWVLVAGQALVIIGGGFDLSIGSVVGLTAVTIGLLLKAGLGWGLASLIAILVGTGCGVLNGLIIAGIGVNALIATLGTLFIFQGIALVATGSETELAFGTGLVDKVGQADAARVPIPVWIGLAVVLLATALLRWTRFGRETFFVGANQTAARLVGVKVDRIRMAGYAIMGCLAGIGGALALARVGTANADTGSGEELAVIAAAVLGGAALTGGEGSVIGAALAVLLIQVVDDAVILLNVSVFYQQLVVGVVLIVAVVGNLLTARIRDRLGVRAALSGSHADATSAAGQPAVPLGGDG
jgi:ribose/xylose/arabinose/galactoside ABC-type transport system permease subunit